MLAWYVAQTHYREELRAEEFLRERYESLQPFNPKCYVRSIQRGRKVTIEKPYISGYIFIRFDVVENYEWRMIHSCPGIKRLFSTGAEAPTRIREEVMQSLLGICEGDHIIEEEGDKVLRTFLPMGALVRVIAGPLEGRVGKVKWSDGERVSAVLSIFGRSLPVVLSASQVELCKS